MEKTLRHGANDPILANAADWVPSSGSFENSVTAGVAGGKALSPEEGERAFEIGERAFSGQRQILARPSAAPPLATSDSMPAGMHGVSPDLTGDSWTATAGGDWSTAADWSSKAVPTASTAATVAATGTYTVSITTPDVAGSLLINDAGATVADTGTLTLGGALSITAGTFALQSGGSLVGGTITTGSAGVFSVQGGVLDGSVYRGTLSVGDSQSLFVDGGLTLEGANGSGAGHIALASGALLDVQDTETLNNGTLSLAGTGATLESGGDNSAQTTLTFGSSFTVLQSGSGQNYLTAGYYNAGGYSAGDTFANNGTISVTGGVLTTTGEDENGIFTNAGLIKVNAGEFQLDYASFTNTGSVAISGTGALDVYESSLTLGAGGSISTTGSGTIIDDYGGTLLGTISSATNIDFAGGSLAGVTYQGPFTLGASQSVAVSNGLTLTGSGSLAVASGAAMYLTGGIVGATALSLASNALLDIQDTETLNNGTLSLAGTGATLESGGDNATQAALTFGSGFTILQSGSGENYLTAGYYLYFSGGYNAAGDTITNNGTISVTGGTLTANSGDSNSTFTNVGVIEVTAGEFQINNDNNGGSFTNTGSVAISGTGALDVYASSLTFGTGGSISTTGSGTIIDDYGGTLLGTISGATNIDFNGGALAGVTWQGAFSLGASQSVAVSNGLTLTGSGSLAVASGAAMYLTGGIVGATALSLASNALLDIQDTETLNNGTLSLAGTGATLESGGDNATQAALTFGSGFAILQSGTGQNYLTAGFYRSGNTYVGDTITNNGTISVTGGTLTANSTDSNGIFTNAGAIVVTAGEFQLQYDNNGGSFTNTGSIAITGTGALDVYASSLTLGAGGSISTTGGGVIIDDTGGTLLGTISSATNIDFNGGALAGVTWQGPFTLGASQSVAVSNGLTLTGSGSLALASGAGMNLTGGLVGATSLSLASSAGLDVLDSETLNNGTLFFTGTGATLQTGSNNGPQAALTLGSGLTVLQSGSGQNYLTAGYYHTGNTYQGDSITNDGTIAVTSGTLTVNSTDGNGTFTNKGLLIASGGGVLDLSSVSKFTNVTGGTLTAGIFEAAANSTLQLTNNTYITTDAATIILSGTASTIQSTQLSTGTEISLDQKLATIASTGALKILAGRSFSAAGAFTDAGNLQLGGGTFTGTSAGLTIASTGTLSGFGTAKTNVADAGLIFANGGTLTIAGTIAGAGALQAAAGATLDLTTGGTLNQPMSGAGTLKLDGSTAYALSTGSTIGIGILQVDAGVTLSGAATLAGGLANNGTVSVTSGDLLIDGPVTGSGIFAISSGATLDLAGGGSFAGAITGNGGTLQIDGASPFILQAGATLGNEAILVDAIATLELTQGGNLNGDIVGAGTLRLDGSSTYTYNAAIGFDPSIGTMLIDTGATLNATGRFGQNIALLGNLSVTTGTFTTGGSLTGSGSVSIGAGAQFTTAITGDSSAAGTITDNGTLQLGGGTLTSASGISVGNTGTLSGTGTVAAAIANAGTILVGSALAIDGALSGSGILNISSGATLDLAGGGSFGGTVYGNGSVLQIDGASPLILQAGASLGNASIVVDAGATLDLTQGGNLNGDIAGAGTLKLDGSTTYTYNSATGFDPLAGTILIDTGATLNATGQFAENVALLGALDITTGEFVIGGALLGSGKAAISAGATLDLGGANLLGPDALTAPISGAGTLKLDSGTYTLAGATLAPAATLVDAGGTLSGSGTISGKLTDTGSVAASGGTLVVGSVSGSGTLGAGAGAVLNLTAGGTLTEVFGGAGTLQLDHGTYTLAGQNLALATVLLNAGATLSGTGTVSGALTNAGSLAVSGGTLSVVGAFSGAGAASVAANATLDLFGGGSLAGTIAGAGTLQLDGSAATTLTAKTPLVSTVKIDAGATFSSTGTNTIKGLVTDAGVLSVSSGLLSVSSAVSGGGTLLAAAGTVLHLQGGGALGESVLGAGELLLDGAYSFAGTTPFAVTNLAIDYGASLSATGTIASVVNVPGTLTAASGTLVMTGSVGGNGTLQAASGAVMDLKASSFLPKALIGAGTIKLDGPSYAYGTATISTVATLAVDAGVHLSGAGTIASAVIDAGSINAASGTLQLSGAVSGAGGLSATSTAVLDLTAGGTLTQAISGAGTLELGGAYTLGTASPTIGAIKIDAAGALSGAGTITGAVTNAGSIAATSGTLSFLGAVTNNGMENAASGLLSFKNAVSGTGTLEIGGAGTLSMLAGAAAGQTVDFLSTTGALDLTTPKNFLGSIAGFGGSNAIDLKNTLATGFTYNAGSLTLTGASGTLATLTFDGSYSSSSFTLATDGHGGTAITFV